MSSGIPRGTVAQTAGVALESNTPAATAMGTIRLAFTMGVIGQDGVLLGMPVPSPAVEEVPQMGMADGPMTIPHLVTTEITISRRAGILHVETQEALGMDVEARVALQMEAPAAAMGITVQATQMALSVTTKTKKKLCKYGSIITNK